MAIGSYNGFTKLLKVLVFTAVLVSTRWLCISYETADNQLEYDIQILPDCSEAIL